MLSYLPMAWVGDHLFSYGQALVAGFTINCPESGDTVMTDLREIGPTYYFAPPRVFENLLTQVMIRMEDAGAIKRKLFHYFMDVARRCGAEILDGKPGVAALCCTPQAKVEMHPGPPYEYWVARALLVDLVESNERGRIVCTVLTSHGMKHDQDTPESVRIEFLTQVTRFVAAIASLRTSDQISSFSRSHKNGSEAVNAIRQPALFAISIARYTAAFCTGFSSRYPSIYT